MRSTTTALAIAATLLAAPMALAQGQQQGTVGSPTAPGGGGSSMAQGTPGTPGTTNAPGVIAPPAADMPQTRTQGRAEPNATGTDNPPTTAMPVAGANSFTEGQARDRIAAAGYTDIQGLKKDEQGVWRGQAMQNGQRVDVGLDFKGQVVTGNAPAK
ncbi:hypothetical protein E0493_16190 [Roseomonas sp. M0104]|uniref:PepSY domain-containing protein n=1 Tax=Teichococcus coralli TaxID=2545983 RepID=A0A845BBC0_9PROT|nr:hypothetical protein [Pseudoroseomonas coralli]MXP64893.1 hypothetical protein [Pseudoroseomonas coralli]